MDFIVAGLGNPGERYRITRHNAGFLALDYYSEKHGFSIKSAKHKAFCGKYTLSSGGECFDILFIKPQTFMNLSGEALRDASRFYKLPPERVLVITDDTALPAGKLRIRKEGSDGGHNGLKNIILHLNSDAFPRLRIGVGGCPPEWEMIDWVTAPFPEADRPVMFDAFARAAEAVDAFISRGADFAMNRFN